MSEKKNCFRKFGFFTRLKWDSDLRSYQWPCMASGQLHNTVGLTCRSKPVLAPDWHQLHCWISLPRRWGHGASAPPLPWHRCDKCRWPQGRSGSGAHSPPAHTAHCSPGQGRAVPIPGHLSLLPAFLLMSTPGRWHWKRSTGSWEWLQRGML